MRLSTVLVLLGTASGAFATPAPPAKPAPAAPPAANPPAKPAAEAPLPPFKPMDMVPVNALMAKIKTEEAALAKMAQLAPKIAKMPDAKPISGAPAPAPAPGKPAPAQPAVPRGLAHRSLHKVLRSLGRRDTCTDATHNFRVHFQAWNAALPAVQAADRELATLSQRLDATSRAIQNLQHPRGEPVRNARAEIQRLTGQYRQFETMYAAAANRRNAALRPLQQAANRMQADKDAFRGSYFIRYCRLPAEINSMIQNEIDWNYIRALLRG